ncbi:MAG: hypothetical protein NZ921_02135 [Candidatus Caldarchaeum sp.]|nr:hypothetical protein [Candidatus Caldarchaeum sp.]
MELFEAAEACYDGFGAATDVDVSVVLLRPLGLGEGAKLRASLQSFAACTGRTSHRRHASVQRMVFPYYPPRGWRFSIIDKNSKNQSLLWLSTRKHAR